MPKPPAISAGYSQRALPDKLGIKPGARIGLIGAPKDFDQTLGDLPAGAVLRDGARGPCELRIVFAQTRAELTRRMTALERRADGIHFWFCWPKLTGPLAGELGESDVRRCGLAAGFVDYKVCAVDHAWSGLKFAPRKRQP
jgi:hypothetical protein